MATLPFESTELDALLLRLNAVMAKEGTDIPDAGGNPSDDEVEETLQEVEGDLTEDEITQEIESMNDEQQDALIALFWIGRGDSDPEEWDDLLSLARERHTGMASSYLLSKPLVSTYIADGIERLRESGELD
ncbi:DUF3775 domain-containing protein [Acidimangrovimonas pyrenivorans]|uniref:DUF3775 domain-containing protein n=1 Tax=Acidimangrovimonas pyrenivorans TaxID=2030798 RepID=A0ABV7AF55_9RHOB